MSLVELIQSTSQYIYHEAMCVIAHGRIPAYPWQWVRVSRTPHGNDGAT